MKHSKGPHCAAPPAARTSNPGYRGTCRTCRGFPWEQEEPTGPHEGVLEDETALSVLAGSTVPPRVTYVSDFGLDR